MAWNQPNNPKSPWGRKSGPGGANLDEAVKQWQRKLQSLLRSRGGGGRDGSGGPAGPEGRGGGPSLAVLLGLLALIMWFGSGFYQIKTAERGVIQRFGQLVAVRGQGWGWHWPRPIETLTKVNVANVNSSEYKSRVLTSDVNLVDLRFGVQYQLSDPIKALFQVRDPESTLREVSESAIREIVGQSALDDVLVGATRPQITQRSKELIQKTLDFYNTGITVTTVNLTDVQVPEPVIPSQRDANKALADQERFLKEAQAYANGIIPVAQGAAARMQQDAQAYKSKTIALAQGQTARFEQLAAAYARSPEVTRQRLYIETVENVLSRSRKIVLDSKPGEGGNMLYLPLDKLMQSASPADTSATQDDETTVRPMPAESGTVASDGRSRGER